MFNSQSSILIQIGAIAVTLFSLSLPRIIAAAYVRQNTLHVDVRLVNVYATVIDSNDRYVGSLKRDDFRVDEDGKLQALTHFAQDQGTPVSFGIIFDKSGS